MSDSTAPHSALPVGRVFLVGAGPGDPKLITLRGVECLAMADLVLYDYLVNPALLRHVPSTAELVCLGHPHRGREIPQAEVNRRMVAAAQMGRTVVRLKCGDPNLFGRGAEETAVLRQYGVPYECVPGVTAAFAAAASMDIPLTHRDFASAVAFITGHRRQDGGIGRPSYQRNNDDHGGNIVNGEIAGNTPLLKRSIPETGEKFELSQEVEPIDYAYYAAFPGTLVFYMGMKTAADWSEALVRGGRAADTPVAVVRHVGWPDQAATHCTLGTVAATIERQNIRPPALVFVYDSAAVIHER